MKQKRPKNSIPKFSTFDFVLQRNKRSLCFYSVLASTGIVISAAIYYYHCYYDHNDYYYYHCYSCDRFCFYCCYYYYLYHVY